MGTGVLPLSLDDPGAKVTYGSRALVTADKGNGPQCVRSFAGVGAGGRPVHRLASHPCSERRHDDEYRGHRGLHRHRASARSEHWATALNRDGRKVFDRALPNDEERLRALYEKLADHGSLLVVVDQPATIGALAVAVAQDMGITVGYLPGLSMRRIADLTPGSAKTDAKDAAVIAGAARTMPHTLRAVSTSDEDAAALSMLTGFDLDLARQVNQTANRIRGLYTQIHPALEAVVGPWLEHDAVLEVIAAWPTPADLKRAGKARIDARLKKHGCRRHATWAGQIVSALEHQSVVVAGTDAAAVVLPHLARQLISLHAQRADVAAQVEALVEAHPLYEVLISMPGIGVRTAAVFLAETLGKTSRHRRPAGLLRRARSRHTPLRLIDPWRARLPRRQQEAQARHVPVRLRLTALRPRLPGLLPAQTRPRQTALGQAVLALAHRRTPTLHAMIRNNTLYNPQPATKLPTAA